MMRLNDTLTPTLPFFHTPLTRRRLLGLAAAFGIGAPLAGCGGGGSPSGHGLGPTVSQSGRVVLPAGVAPLSSVVNLAGSAPVAADGAFPARLFAGGPTLTQGKDATGKVALYGFLEPGHTELSVRSTAEALTYLALGAFAQAPTVRAKAISLLRGQNLDRLEAAIRDALVAGGTGWTQSAQPGVAAALQATLQSLRGRGMIVTPTERVSGLQVVGDFVSACKVTNDFRRRARIYLTQLSYQRDDGTVLGVPDNLTAYDLSPTSGVTGLVSTLTDLALGNQAYAQVGIDVPTPLNPAAAARSTYRLWGIGPGVHLGALGEAPAEVKLGLISVCFQAILFDFVLPLLINTILPAYSERIEDIVQLLDAGDVTKDLLNVLTSSGPLVDLVLHGKFVEACGEVLNLILATDTFQIVLLTAITAIIGNWKDSLPGGTPLENYVAESWRAIDGALDAADAGFTLFDSAVQALDIASSSLVEKWDVTVTKTTVRVLPDNPTVYNLDRLALTAQAPVDSQGTLVYHWKVTGGWGHLTDTRGHSGAEFDSSDRTVTYFGDKTPTAGSTPSDTVAATVYLIPDGTSKRILVGTGTTTIQRRARQSTTVSGRIAVVGDAAAGTVKVHFICPVVDGSRMRGEVVGRHDPSFEFGFGEPYVLTVNNLEQLRQSAIDGEVYVTMNYAEGRTASEVAQIAAHLHDIWDPGALTWTVFP